MKWEVFDEISLFPPRSKRGAKNPKTKLIRCPGAEGPKPFCSRGVIQEMEPSNLAESVFSEIKTANGAFCPISGTSKNMSQKGDSHFPDERLMVKQRFANSRLPKSYLAIMDPPNPNIPRRALYPFFWHLLSPRGCLFPLRIGSNLLVVQGPLQTVKREKVSLWLPL